LQKVSPERGLSGLGDIDDLFAGYLKAVGLQAEARIALPEEERRKVVEGILPHLLRQTEEFVISL